MRANRYAEKRVGIIPLLLALLLAVRVAASPAMQCQHELAVHSALSAQAATGIAYQAGDLCGLDLPDQDRETTEDLLNALCPFFVAPGILPECGADAAISELSYSRNWSIPAILRLGAEQEVAGYHSRAPPDQG